MTTMPGLSDADGIQLLGDTLRLYVGQGKRLSWDDLAAATGDSARKLRSYVEQDAPCMPAPVLMRVFAVLPPEAFGRICMRMGFGPAAPLGVDDDATVRRALTGAARLVADANEYLEDGHLSPLERAALAGKAHDLLPALAVIAGGKP